MSDWFAENAPGASTGTGTPDISGLIDQAADRYGVPRALAHGIANVESNLKPNAVSPKGATGVMQLMPATARGLGVTDIRDPAQNIDAGVRYIAQLSDKYGGDPTLVAAAYNAGPGAVDKYKGVPPYPETQKYVAKLQPTIAQLTGGQSQPTASQAGAGVDDILARIGRGENVDITPETIMQVAFGGQQQPAAAPAPAAPAAPSGGDNWFARNAPPPPPAPPPEPESAKSRFWKSFVEANPYTAVVSGLKEWWNRPDATKIALEAFNAGNRIRAGKELPGDREKLERGMQTPLASPTPTMVPMGSEPVLQAAAQATHGDIAGGAGTLTGAYVAPVVAGKVIAAAPQAIPATGAFTKAFGQTLADAPPSPTGKVLGRVAGAALGREMLGGTEGVVLGGYAGGEIGAKLPAVPGAVRAGLRAARTAVAEPAAVPVPPTVIPPRRITSGDVITQPLQLERGPLITPYEQPEPIPPSRQLPPGRDIYQMPPAADTSYVRAVPAEYAQTEPGFQAQPEAPAPAKTPGQIYAESEGYNWAKLSAKDRLAMEHVARARENFAKQQPLDLTTPAPPVTQPTAPPPTEPIVTPPPAPPPAAPVTTPPAAPPAAETPLVPGQSAGKLAAKAAQLEQMQTLYDSLQKQQSEAGGYVNLRPSQRAQIDQVGANVDRLSREIADLRNPPVETRLEPGQIIYPGEQPAVLRNPRAAQLAAQLAEQMRTGAAEPAATAAAAPPAEPAAALKAAEPPPKAVANRTAKAQRFIDVFNQAGVGPGSVAQIERGMVSPRQIQEGMAPRWGNIAESMGEEEPSMDTVAEIYRLMGIEQKAKGAVAADFSRKPVAQAKAAVEKAQRVRRGTKKETQ